MRECLRGEGNIYKQAKSRYWWMHGSMNGRRFRESTGLEATEENENRAHKLLRKRISEAEAGKPMGAQVRRTTVAELVRILLDEYEMHGRRSVRRVKYATAHLLEFFGSDTRVADLTSDAFVRYVLHRRSEGAAAATTNRELAAAKRAFVLGQRAGRVAVVPYIAMLPERNARAGFIDYPQFNLLQAELPDRVKDVVAFLYLSGWRVSEALTLEWRDLDRDLTEVRLRPERSKNSDGRLLPLEGELRDIISRASKARRLDCPYVFHVAGKPIKDFRRTWATATAKVGLSGLLVHDLRRSAIRNFRRAGLFEEQAMKLSGHRTTSTFKRYNITSDAELRDAVATVGAYLAAQPTEPKVMSIDQRKSSGILVSYSDLGGARLRGAR